MGLPIQPSLRCVARSGVQLLPAAALDWWPRNGRAIHPCAEFLQPDPPSLGTTPQPIEDSGPLRLSSRPHNSGTSHGDEPTGLTPFVAGCTRLTNGSPVPALVDVRRRQERGLEVPDQLSGQKSDTGKRRMEVFSHGRFRRRFWVPARPHRPCWCSGRKARSEGVSKMARNVKRIADGLGANVVDRMPGTGGGAPSVHARLARIVESVQAAAGAGAGETRGPAERCKLGASSQGADERSDAAAAEPADGAGRRRRAQGQPDADRGADPRGRPGRHAGAITRAHQLRSRSSTATMSCWDGNRDAISIDVTGEHRERAALRRGRVGAADGRGPRLGGDRPSGRQATESEPIRDGCDELANCWILACGTHGKTTYAQVHVPVRPGFRPGQTNCVSVSVPARVKYPTAKDRPRGAGLNLVASRGTWCLKALG